MAKKESKMARKIKFQIDVEGNEPTQWRALAKALNKDESLEFFWVNWEILPRRLEITVYTKDDEVQHVLDRFRQITNRPLRGLDVEHNCGAVDSVVNYNADELRYLADGYEEMNPKPKGEK